jgi:hypothetical protein
MGRRRWQRRQSVTRFSLRNQPWMICHLSRPLDRKSNSGERLS